VLLRRLVLDGHRVIALTLDLGESDAVSGPGSAEQLDGARRKALALGASDALVLDVRARFVKELVLPALRANVMYQGVYPLSAALSRPLIGATLVDVAHRFGADAVAHGCTGKGNDQVRIELAVRALDPTLTVLAPLRDAPLSRPDAIAFAREHGIPVSSTLERPYSIDANLWGRSIEAGVLEDPWTAPPEDAFAWTAAPNARPAGGEDVVIDFERGEPAGAGLDGVDLIAQLNQQAGGHGIGRIDLIEDRVVGLKSREVYEAPAALVLIAAHKALERLVLTRDELRLKSPLDQRYAELVYDGLWPAPLRKALDAFNDALAERMTGRVRLHLAHGNATVTGTASPHALYSEALATYGSGDRFRHDAAAGFTALWGLPLEIAARSERDVAVAG